MKGLPAGAEKRLKNIVEALNRFLTITKTFRIKSANEKQKIESKFIEDTKIIDGLVERTVLLVFIDCGKYDGQYPKKKK